MVKMIIDYAKCVGDANKTCVEVCPVSILRDKKSAKPEVSARFYALSH